MYKRSYAWRAVKEVLAPYSKDWVGFDPEKLIANKENILLTDGNRNFALFEADRPGVYYGHYLFDNARGAEALRISKGILKHFFEHYDCSVVMGQLPIKHLGAIWLSKRLGFELIGTENTLIGPCLRVFLPKERLTQ